MDSSIGHFIKSSWNDPIPTAPAIEFPTLPSLPSFPNPTEFYTQYELNKAKIKSLEEDLHKSKQENTGHILTIKRIKIAAIISAAVIVAIG